jgi:hypothetical protein
MLVATENKIDSVLIEERPEGLLHQGGIDFVIVTDKGGVKRTVKHDNQPRSPLAVCLLQGIRQELMLGRSHSGGSVTVQDDDMGQTLSVLIVGIATFVDTPRLLSGMGTRVHSV